MLSKDFKEFVACLNARAVDYLIVGGYAVAWHGHPRHTGDLDVWVRRDAGNAARLMQALGDFGFGSLGLSPADFEGPQQVVQLGYPPFRIDLMTDFDGPDCAFAAPRRDATTTPLQALTLLNHQFTLDMSDALAERILSDLQTARSSDDIQQPEPAACVERAFERVFSRKPIEAERTAGANLIQSCA